MAIPVEMPKMSDTMVEGVLSAWLVEEGASVASGDVIAQVETDKATMDLEAYDDGVLLKRMIGEGDAVPIGALIAVLGKEGEDISGLLAKYSAGDGASTPAAPEKPAEAPAPAAPAAPAKAPEPDAQQFTSAEGAAAQAPAQSGGDGAPQAAPAAQAAPAPQAQAAPQMGAQDGGRQKASPLARKMASEAGLELGGVTGSGPEGRIVRRDVEAAMQAAPAQAVSAPQAAPAVQAAPQAGSAGAGYRAVPLTSMRRAIARRLVQSKFTAPHFYLTVDVDMEQAVTFRAQLNALAEAQRRGKVSINDLITKACAVALRAHPYVNASWAEEAGEIRLHEAVHVAIAVAIDDGLITPVIRDADRKGLAQIAEESKDLATRAREKKLTPDEFEGSTFTTSNLGGQGIEAFTSIINPPNVCILAIGAVRDEPVVKGGAVVPGKRMKLTLSCDHRVVDGARGAAFLTALQGYLEQPLTMLL